MFKLVSKTRGSGQTWTCLPSSSFLVACWLPGSWLTELPRSQGSQGPCQLCILRSLTSLRNSGSAVPTTVWALLTSSAASRKKPRIRMEIFCGGLLAYTQAPSILSRTLLGLALEANIWIKHKTLLTFPSWVTLAQGLVGDWTLGKRETKT